MATLSTQVAALRRKLSPETRRPAEVPEGLARVMAWRAKSPEDQRAELDADLAEIDQILYGRDYIPPSPDVQDVIDAETAKFESLMFPEWVAECAAIDQWHRDNPTRTPGVFPPRHPLRPDLRAFLDGPIADPTSGYHGRSE